MATQRTENTFGGVVQLVNKLQRAAGNIGDNAASEGSGGMPSLWNLLPSIVVIGGQVTAMQADDMLLPGYRIVVIAGCTCQACLNRSPLQRQQQAM